MLTKKCSHPQCSFAGQEQPIINFGLDSSRKDGYAYYCKLCARRNAKLHQVKNKCSDLNEYMTAVDQLIFGTPPNWKKLTDTDAHYRQEILPRGRRKNITYQVETIRKVLEMAVPLLLSEELLLQIDWNQGLQNIGNKLTKHQESPIPSVAEILYRFK